MELSKIDFANLIFDLQIAVDTFRQVQSSDPREGYFNASHAQLLDKAVKALEQVYNEEKEKLVIAYKEKVAAKIQKQLLEYKDEREDRMINQDQLKATVDRFLRWKLPENFNPDAGISFKPTFNDHMPFGPCYYNPTGTNLLDASQAEEMVRFILHGLIKDE